MMKNMMKTACAIAVLAASANVMAESADLLIKGTISPTACEPVFMAGGVIDYGTIHPSTLKTDDYTNLPLKDTSLTISCNAPAKLAFNIINNRKGTVPGRPSPRDFDYPSTGAKLFNNAQASAMGLGMSNEKAVGAWAIKPTAVTVDEAIGALIDTNDSGQSWAKYAKISIGSSKSMLTSAAKAGEVLPVAGKVFKYDFAVDAYLNKTADLDITKPVILDGSATFEVVYL